MIGFVFSAVLTVVASTTAAALHNDISFFTFINKLRDARKRFWIRVLDRLILGFSDQQLITGISILLIGFIKICHISTYHFYVVTNLAMFSCSTHLASVLSLRRYFQEHPTVAKIRIVVMLFFALCLAAALLLTGSSYITDDTTIRCSLRCTIKQRNIVGRIIAFLFVLYLSLCYWAALAFVFPNAEIFFTKWLINKPTLWIEAMLGWRYGYQFQERFMHWRPIFPSLVLSFFLQVFWWAVSLGASIFIRVKGQQIVEVSETAWSFGQLLAIFLLTLPFLNAIEIFFGEFVGVKIKDLKPYSSQFPEELKLAQAELATSQLRERSRPAAAPQQIDTNRYEELQLPRRVDTEQRVQGAAEIVATEQVVPVTRSIQPPSQPAASQSTSIQQNNMPTIPGRRRTTEFREA